MKVSLVLPAYNEASAVAGVVEGAVRAGVDAVVVVDDGSGDGTHEAALDAAVKFPGRVVVVRHEANRGLARALVTGFRRAAELDSGVVVTMDADGTHDPEVISELASRVRSGADVAVASRYVKGAAVCSVPLWRRILSRVASLLCRARFGIPGLKDYSSGYRAYGSELLKKALAEYGDGLLSSRGFECQVELVLKLRRLKPDLIISEVPIRLDYGLKAKRSSMRVLATAVGFLGLLLRGVDVSCGSCGFSRQSSSEARAA